ncbi:hypothetical protein NDU88_004579 [Pleurodeles waltl]|uniref:Uncharacterized protein n=1 Tax=Pleurodeles waltl TaxID=8319 RepID=A0AAV7MUZ2_PLEWA|nr:hypothetical protein NDU88_004579 [Pleurodeles waltl]
MPLAPPTGTTTGEEKRADPGANSPPVRLLRRGRHGHRTFGSPGGRDCERRRHVENEYLRPLMLVLGAQNNPGLHLYTPLWLWKNLTKQIIADTALVSSGVKGLFRLLAHALKIKMPPKPFRNLGEKIEGVKVTQAGRGKGELTGANKRLATIVAKPAVENMLKGVKTSMESMPEAEDNQREAREKKPGPSTEIKQPQAQQYDWAERLEHQDGEGGASIFRPATEGENLHKILSNTKNLGKIAGKDPQSVEWGKDNSDKFYSLTEESDLSSGDHSLGGSEDSETSETEDKTSSNEPTVRQLRRQRKSVKTRPCAQGSPENPSSTGSRTLKWDYSGIGLTDSSSITNQGSANGNKESDIGPPTYSPSAMGAEAGMLQSIYSSIKELQTETRVES